MEIQAHLKSLLSMHWWSREADFVGIAATLRLRKNLPWRACELKTYLLWALCLGYEQSMGFVIEFARLRADN